MSDNLQPLERTGVHGYPALVPASEVRQRHVKLVQQASNRHIVPDDARMSKPSRTGTLNPTQWHALDARQVLVCSGTPGKRQTLLESIAARLGKQFPGTHLSWDWDAQGRWLACLWSYPATHEPHRVETIAYAFRIVMPTPTIG